MKKKLLGIIAVICLLSITASMAYAEQVYTTERAKKYHKKECPFLQRIKNKEYIQEISKEEAVEQGKGPCRRCYKEDLLEEGQETNKSLSDNKDSEKKPEQSKSKSKKK